MKSPPLNAHGRPEGEALTKAGQCPKVQAGICFFCTTGHPDDCHHPLKCEDARCSYLTIKDDLDAYSD